MPTEEQLEQSTAQMLYAGSYTRSGQLLTITDRTVTKLSFLVTKYGAPTGDMVLGIRDDEDALIVSKVWGDVSAIAVAPTYTWIEVEFVTPQYVNELVIIYAEFTGGDGGNGPAIGFQNSDVKAGEVRARYEAGWYQAVGSDCTYIYTYGEEAPPAAKHTFRLNPRPRTRMSFHPNLKLG